MKSTVKKICLVIIITILTCISYYLIHFGIKDHNIRSINYRDKTDINYKVYLKENNFFEEPYLGMNRTYISSLIDYIDLWFTYDLDFSSQTKGTYTYYVTGTMIADRSNSDNNEGYWSKKYTLTDPVTKNWEGNNNVNLSTNVRIDYQKYNTLLKEFKNTYGLSVDGKLKIEFVIESNSTSEIIKKEIPVKSTATLNIPLTQQVLDLSIESQNSSDAKTITEIDKKIDKLHIAFIVLGIIIGLSSIYLAILFILAFIKFSASRSEYEKTLKKILSTYDGIIVNVQALPTYNENYQIIKVHSFDELIDAHSEVRKPINFYEEKAGYKSIFKLSSENIVWEYVLENKNNEKKGKR